MALPPPPTQDIDVPVHLTLTVHFHIFTYSIFEGEIWNTLQATANQTPDQGSTCKTSEIKRIGLLYVFITSQYQLTYDVAVATLNNLPISCAVPSRFLFSFNNFHQKTEAEQRENVPFSFSSALRVVLTGHYRSVSLNCRDNDERFHVARARNVSGKRSTVPFQATPINNYTNNCKGKEKWWARKLKFLHAVQNSNVECVFSLL